MAIRLGIFAAALGVALFAGSAANASVLYSNGPVNGTVEGYTINFGFSVTNSFTLSSDGTANSAVIGIWNMPGDTIQQLDWSIGSTTFGSDIASGTAATSDIFLFNNEYGYPIYADTFSLPGVSLSAGTYWLTLQNAVATNSDPAYWDQNSGPSSAQDSSLGIEPSETFAICDTGSCSLPSAAVPEPITLSLFGAGLAGAAAMRRRKKKVQA